MSEIWRPKDFQDEGRCFLFDTSAAALWWRMGRGKTVTTASAGADLIDIGLARQILVVAPVRVATSTWPNEFRKWQHLSGLRWQVIRGTAKERRQQALRKADVHLINWELFHWLLDEFKLDWRWDLVILDESSKVKSQSTRNYNTVKEIRQKQLTDRLWELTGSPSPNGLKDVWAPVYLMDRGRRLGRTEDSFLKRFFFRDRSGTLQIRGKPALNEINDRISDVVYALRSAVTGNEPVINEIEFELPPDVYQQYRQLENTTFLEIEGKEVTAAQAAALTGKLLQFAGGAVYTEHPEWVEVHQEKLKLLQEVVDGAEGEPIIVAYTSRHERERILAAYPQAVAIDEVGGDLETEWNAGRIPILVMHPASGGHGLNLQFGGNIIFWFGLTWNLEWFEQLIARLHGRHGQDKEVMVHLPVALNTMDEEAKLRVEGKASTQEALMIAQERRRRR